MLLNREPHIFTIFVFTQYIQDLECLTPSPKK